MAALSTAWGFGPWDVHDYTSATLRFHQVGDGALPVLAYEARFARVGHTEAVSLTAQDFARWTGLFRMSARPTSLPIKWRSWGGDSSGAVQRWASPTGLVQHAVGVAVAAHLMGGGAHMSGPTRDIGTGRVRLIADRARQDRNQPR